MDTDAWEREHITRSRCWHLDARLHDEYERGAKFRFWLLTLREHGMLLFSMYGVGPFSCMPVEILVCMKTHLLGGVEGVQWASYPNFASRADERTVYHIWLPSDPDPDVDTPECSSLALLSMQAMHLHEWVETTRGVANMYRHHLRWWLRWHDRFWRVRRSM